MPQILNSYRAVQLHVSPYWFTLCAFSDLGEVWPISMLLYPEWLGGQRARELWQKQSYLNPVSTGLWLWWTFWPPMRPNTPSTFCVLWLRFRCRSKVSLRAFFWQLLVQQPVRTFLASCVTLHSYRLSWVRAVLGDLMTGTIEYTVCKWYMSNVYNFLLRLRVTAATLNIEFYMSSQNTWNCLSCTVLHPVSFVFHQH